MMWKTAGFRLTAALALLLFLLVVVLTGENNAISRTKAEEAFQT